MSIPNPWDTGKRVGITVPTLWTAREKLGLDDVTQADVSAQIAAKRILNAAAAASPKPPRRAPNPKDPAVRRARKARRKARRANR